MSQDYFAPINIRMFRDKLPEVNQLVTGIVTKQIGNMNGTGLQGFHVELNQFANINAFLPSSNLTKKRKVTSLRKLIRIGQKMTFNVVNIDDGNIILDMAHVDENDNVEMSQTEKNINMLMQIGMDIARLWCVTKKLSWNIENVEHVLDNTVWNLYSTEEIDPDIVQKVINTPNVLFEESDMFDEEFLNMYMKLFQTLIETLNATIQQTITLYTIVPNGMRLISKLLTAIENKNLIIECPATPTYIISLNADSFESGKAMFKNITDKIQSLIDEYGIHPDAIHFSYDEPIMTKQPEKHYLRMKTNNLQISSF